MAVSNQFSANNPLNKRPNHSAIVAWQLFEMVRPDRVLHFQFNPSEMEENVSVVWDEKEIGGSTAITQFGHRKPKIFRFDMFLNEWGNHKTGGSTDKPTFQSIEYQLSVLDSFMKSRKVNGKLFSPPVLYFFWRVHIPVTLTDMTIKRLYFRQKGYWLADGGGNDVKRFNAPVNTNPSIEEPTTGSMPPRPNDAIRATVSVTLKEFIISPLQSRTERSPGMGKRPFSGTNTLTSPNLSKGIR